MFAFVNRVLGMKLRTARKPIFPREQEMLMVSPVVSGAGQGLPDLGGDKAHTHTRDTGIV
jgi:hypothetical protein